MSCNEIHEDDIGTRLLLTMNDCDGAIDISTASTKQLILEKPDGTTATETLSFLTDGSDGKVYYDFVLDDLDQVGSWGYQVKIVMTGTWRSNIVHFTVYPNI